MRSGEVKGWCNCQETGGLIAAVQKELGPKLIERNYVDEDSIKSTWAIERQNLEAEPW